jgi:hypothetical protein
VVQAQASRSAELAALAAQAAAFPRAEPVAEDAAAVLRPAVAHAPGAPQQAARDAAAVLLRVAPGAAAALPSAAP